MKQVTSLFSMRFSALLQSSIFQSLNNLSYLKNWFCLLSKNSEARLLQVLIIFLLSNNKLNFIPRNRELIKLDFSPYYDQCVIFEQWLAVPSK